MVLQLRRSRADTIAMHVVEAPTVGAGILSGSEFADLDLGWSAALPTERPVSFWNNGPGLLAVVVARAASGRGRCWGDRISRLLALRSTHA